jgi:hypothetical protein
MTKGWLLALIITFGLGGCAGLTQFPTVERDYNASLRGLDADYAATLDTLYGPDGTPVTNVDAGKAKVIRNKMIERRMAVIDAHFKEFQAGLVKENVRADFGIALVGIGVGAAGSLVAETASQILSAISGGLAGAQAAYGKAVLYDKAMSALLAQMQAGRKIIAVQIFQRWNQDLDQYPMWMARTDLEAYYFAGSLPGAILGTAADAKRKEAEADAVLLRMITAESVTPEMFLARENLESAIDGLSVDKAKALVAKMASEFPEIKPFVELQYPSNVRAADANGDKAKLLLKRLVSNTVRNSRDAEKWRNTINGL